MGYMASSVQQASLRKYEKYFYDTMMLHTSDSVLTYLYFNKKYRTQQLSCQILVQIQ